MSREAKTEEPGPVVALALTAAERALVERAVRQLVRREGPSQAASAVLEMNAHALRVGELNVLCEEWGSLAAAPEGEAVHRGA